ncbi:MAG TPA: MarP family serine protease [Patescibacteria group bacterium]|nr:MarP family serine protease [Patescibacteria group bacterium]
MNWLDVFIIIFLIAAVVRGLEIGFIRQFCSTFGFFVGLFIGALIEGKVMHLAHAPDTRAFLALTITLSSAFLFMGIGEYSGWLLKFKVSDSPLANKLDRYFGSVLAGVALLAAIWLGASIFRGVPSPMWQRQIRGSRVVAVLDHGLPSAPATLTKLGHLINPNGFPQVFTGLEPAPDKDAPLPDMGEFTPAVQAVRASVVKVEGKGCGGIVEGSGFVADSGEVITNAHVVAGVTDPTVLDIAGTHRARVVLFDADLDIAILRTSGLAGKPLAMDTKTAANSSAAVILGYPGGGDLSAKAAAVLEAFAAKGRNIYNQGETERNIYSVKGDVQQGNSGGPLINKDGTVIGVIFAKSTSYDNLGYALAMDAVVQDLHKAGNQTVSNGTCAQ